MAHKFNATNEPNTCLWCGEPLYRNSTWTSVKTETQHGFRSEKTKETTEYRGWEGNGFFCTLRCGEAFGIAMARLGKRFEPLSKE